MRVFLLLIVMLVATNCATNNHNTHKINHCDGIDIPICWVEVEGKRTHNEEIEFQEKQFKQKMLRTMTLILDQTLQTILSGL